MSVARALRRSFSTHKKTAVTCRGCQSTTYITKEGKYYKHRMPPKVFGYNIPLRAGPICKLSGKNLISTKLAQSSET